MTPQNTGLPRRIGAMLYDTLLIFAVLFIETTPFIAVRGGEAVEAGDPLYSVTMFVVVFGFFTFFWTRPGRTLGMQSWGLQLESFEGRKPTFRQAALRFFAALLSWLPLGLGFIWQLWDHDRLTWHDHLSGTRIVHYPKAPKKKETD